MTQNNNNVTIKRGFQLHPENINREGPPKKEFSITNAFREVLAEQNPETKIEKYKELINKALQMAMRGDGDMIKYIINRLEGMPQGSGVNIDNSTKTINVYTPEQIKSGWLAVGREHPEWKGEL